MEWQAKCDTTDNRQPRSGSSSGRYDTRRGRAARNRDSNALPPPRMFAVNLLSRLHGQGVGTPACGSWADGAVMRHSGGRWDGRRERDRRGPRDAPHLAGTFARRSLGRLCRSMFFRLPGAHEHPANASSDCGGRLGRGHRHDQGRHRHAGRAGPNLPRTVREGLPANRLGRRSADMRSEAHRRRCRSRFGRAVYSAAQAGVGQERGHCRRRPGGTGRGVLSRAQRPRLHDLRRESIARRNAGNGNPRGEAAAGCPTCRDRANLEARHRRSLGGSLRTRRFPRRLALEVQRRGARNRLERGRAGAGVGCQDCRRRHLDLAGDL